MPVRPLEISRMSVRVRHHSPAERSKPEPTSETSSTTHKQTTIRRVRESLLLMSIGAILWQLFYALRLRRFSRAFRLCGNGAEWRLAWERLTTEASAAASASFTACRLPKCCSRRVGGALADAGDVEQFGLAVAHLRAVCDGRSRRSGALRRASAAPGAARASGGRARSARLPARARK